MENIYKQLNSYKTELEKKGYNVIYIGLYGSQNYNLHDKDSDIDARAVVLPSFSEYILRKTVSKVYSFEEGEVDVKDVITFTDILKKGNPAFVESARTKYFIGDKSFRGIIEKYRIKPMAVYGMMCEKRAAIEKGLPKSSNMIEEIGYDPKQLHHILRLFDILNSYKETGGAFRTYQGLDREKMISIKRKGLYLSFRKHKETALELVNLFIEVAKPLATAAEFQQVDMTDELLSYLEAKMSEQMFKYSDEYSVRQYRTFGGNIPKRDKESFNKLKELEGEDISYTIYSYLEIL